MGEQDFRAYRTALREHGFREAEARYDETAFGSWFITLEGDPAQRLVWDGKEQWLHLQQRTGDTWVDAWSAEDDRDQTPGSALEQVERLRGHS